MCDDATTSETSACRLCGLETPLAEFYVRKNGKRRSECNPCFCARSRANYAKRRIKATGKPPKTLLNPRTAEPRLTRICVRCKVEKPVAEFYLSRKTGRRRSTCKPCSRAEGRELAQRRAEQEGREYVPRPRPSELPQPTRRFYRICTHCGREKPAPEFPLNRKTGGRYRCCKACRRAKLRASHARNREKRTADTKAWRRANPDKVRVINRRARLKDKEQRAVRAESRKLRQLGVVRQSDTCVQCGARPTELHHETYDDWVHVLSLCHSCHMKLHWREWKRTGTGPVKRPWEFDEEQDVQPQMNADGRR